jgi:DNA-binding MarR family transcriptional regulator
VSDTGQDSALAGLSPVLNAPKTLAIMAVLASSSSTDFSFLRRHLGVSDSDLSKQSAALEAAGLLTIHKPGRGRGAATTYKATRHGRQVYQRHRDALRHLLGA